MKKEIDIQKATELIKDGDTIMVGGFMINGAPLRLLDALAESGKKDLTIIANDAGFEGQGIGKLLDNYQVKKLVATHIGLNKEAGRQMHSGDCEVDLIPQGTLAERIRAGAFGLGGILTPTGVGTLVEERKEKVVVDDKEYLLEVPLKADVALIMANVSDEIGNLQYLGSENNFNQVMATNAKRTIVEARKVIKKGEMNPNFVHTPSVFVDYIVGEEA